MKRDLVRSKDNEIARRPNRTLPHGLRKRYGTRLDKSTGIVVVRPRSVSADKGPTPADEFRLLVDDQPAEAICKQFDESLKQLLYRAYSGDEKAAHLAIAKLGGALAGLRKLPEIQRDMMKSIGESFSGWPAMLSLDHHDEPHRKSKLKYGSGHTPICGLADHEGPTDYWSNLARNAYEVCEINRHLVPLFLTWTKDSHAKTCYRNYWDRTVKTTFYHLANGHDVIAISDWQAECAMLPAEVNEESFAAWWKTVMKAVLEYWHNEATNYDEALKQIGKRDLTEFAQRKLAFKRLGRAFKEIVGLQREKVVVMV